MTAPRTLRVRPLLAALAPLLAACSSDGEDFLPPEVEPARVEVVSRDPHRGLPGQFMPDSLQVRVVDARGRPVPNVLVHFDPAAGSGLVDVAYAPTDGQGLARAAWEPGEGEEQTLAARVDGLPEAVLHGEVVRVPDPAGSMLAGLGDLLAWARQTVRESIPRNPAIQAALSARLAQLEAPGAGGDVLAGGRWVEGRVGGTEAGAPLVAVFLAEGMRAEAGDAVRYVERAVPVVEQFLNVPFPAPQVRIWYGFTVGSFGGGGTLRMEDRGTYESRPLGGALPYDAILIHEVSHSYVGSEALTQFLELYAYNVERTGSEEVADWTHTRGHVAGRDANEGVHALLDVYALIGPEAMAAAYRAVIPLFPAYGEPLSAAAQQAFVDQAPEAAKAQVAAKVARVRA